jgi:hypothetical protein
LDIETSGANNSGPYTDLTPSAGGTNCTFCGAETTTTACFKIIGAQTRGIHGFTCTANGTPYAGLYLDGNNNTIEDGHFEGVVDGIAVGTNQAAAGNTILNITGADGGNVGTSGMIVNIVHICSPAKTYTNDSCSTPGAVTDLLLSDIQSYLPSGSGSAILDDETGALLQSDAVFSTGIGIGLYALGELTSNTAGGYSLFTTFSQPTLASGTIPVPTWGSASNATPSGTCAVGSIFSNSAGVASSKNTLWVCVGPQSSSQWKALL